MLNFFYHLYSFKLLSIFLLVHSILSITSFYTYSSKFLFQSFLILYGSTRISLFVYYTHIDLYNLHFLPSYNLHFSIPSHSTINNIALLETNFILTYKTTKSTLFILQKYCRSFSKRPLTYYFIVLTPFFFCLFTILNTVNRKAFKPTEACHIYKIRRGKDKIFSLVYLNPYLINIPM